MANKKNKSVKNIIKEQKRELQLEERRIQKKRRAIMAACSHTDGKHMTIEYQSKGGMVTCTTCGSRFSVKTISREDLLQATRLVNSALQQVRMLADRDEDGEIISELGKLAADVVSVNDIYERHQERYAKKNNRNRGNRNKDRGGNDSNKFGGYDGIVGIMEASGFYGNKKK